MKKFIYTLLIVIVSASSIISCTEEEVKPVQSAEKNGGTAIADQLK